MPRWSLLLFYCIASVTAIPGPQAIAVKGKLICDNKPATDVLLKLYNKEILIDSRMDKKVSDSDGSFQVSGWNVEFSRIDPVLNIYHDCDDWLPCQRKIKFPIPKKYISWGFSASQVYDIGVIQLAGKLPGESRDCIH